MSRFLEMRGLYICDETKEVKNAHETFICVDAEGYYIKTSMDKVKNRPEIKFSRFTKSNPYSIYNINHKGEMQGIKSFCISDVFDCKRDLDFKCQCGRTFDTNYLSFINGKTTLCSQCTNSHTDLSFDEVKDALKSKGYNLIISDAEYRGITTTPLICVDDLGYKYQVSFNAILRGKKAEIFHRCNPFSLDNIKTYLLVNDMPYECVSDGFISCKVPLQFRCLRCGELIAKAWKDVNVKHKPSGCQGRICCPNCDYTYESTHASVLKQMFLHEYPDTIVEDKSFVNPITNHAMPTDIVNHKLKIAIEVQSQWHDFEDKKIRDEMKRNYWIERGYSFYAPDIRDYTILEICQLFFNIKKLPNYIDYSLNKKLNLKKVQEMLEEGYSVIKIAKEMGVGAHRIYNAIYDNKIKYPDNYQNGIYVPIEQYSKDGTFLGIYPTIVQAAMANNIKPQTLTSAMSKNGRCGGFIWKRTKEDIVKNP